MSIAAAVQGLYNRAQLGGQSLNLSPMYTLTASQKLTVGNYSLGISKVWGNAGPYTQVAIHEVGPPFQSWFWDGAVFHRWADVIDRMAFARTMYRNVKNDPLWHHLYGLEERNVHQRPQSGGRLESLLKSFRVCGLTMEGPVGEKATQLRNYFLGNMQLNDMSPVSARPGRPKLPGTHNVVNLRPLCSQCNSSKGNRS